MEYLTEFIHQNAANAQWIIFGSLLLAGFNLPVSEDGMLFLTAVLALKYPQHYWELFFAVFMGAYLSDLISYWLGRKLGPKLWKIKFFSKMVSKEKIKSINQYYNKYGVLTLIIGRFIPFGVRNALFLTAGLGKMNFLKFALSDLLACTISCTLFFNLYYRFGNQVIDTIKKGNNIVIIIVIIFISILFYKFKSKKISSN